MYTKVRKIFDVLLVLYTSYYKCWLTTFSIYFTLHPRLFSTVSKCLPSFFKLERTFLFIQFKNNHNCFQNKLINDEKDRSIRCTKALHVTFSGVEVM